MRGPSKALALGVSLAAIADAAAAAGGPARDYLLARDDVDVAGAVDAGEQAPSVVQILLHHRGLNGLDGHCSGALINPRTVLTAAHCFTRFSSEAFGLTTETGFAVGTGHDTLDRIRSFIDGASYAEGGLAAVSDVVVHPFVNPDNLGAPEDWADVAMIALAEPVTDIPAMNFLLSPVDRTTHVTMAGYGAFGVGGTGPEEGLNSLRRIGENELDLIASYRDMYGVAVPELPADQTSTTPKYVVDFDDPQRSRAERPNPLCVARSDEGFDCVSDEELQATNMTGGGALPREAGGAPGDSGSPLIADRMAGGPLVLGVMSGTPFGTQLIPNTYGNVTAYTPLYPYFEFITENTPYKYVAARPGDGLWTDPAHWTQELDPHAFVSDGAGGVTNGAPRGNEPGAAETAPKFGAFLGADAAGFDTRSGFQGDLGPLPESSPLLGAGSTGFVPDNTDGTPGAAFANPAQYFDVTLAAGGTTTLRDAAIRIDRLTLAGGDAALRIGRDGLLTALIDVRVMAGRLTVAEGGALQTYGVLNQAGVIGGTGEIRLSPYLSPYPLLLNRGGVVAPGDAPGEIGALTLTGGHFMQGAGGVLHVDVASGAADRLTVLGGQAVLDGTLAATVSAGAAPARGERFTVLSAEGGVDGEFAEVIGRYTPVLFLAPGYAADAVTLTATAASYAGVISGAGDNARAVAAALDGATEPDALPEGALGDVVGALDALPSQAALAAAFASLSPADTFVFDTVSLTQADRLAGVLGARARRGAMGRTGGLDASGLGVRAAGRTLLAQADGETVTDATPAGAAAPEDRHVTVFVAGDLTLGDIRIPGGSDLDSGFVTLGADRALGDHMIAGAALSGAWFETGDDAHGFAGDSWGASAYAGYARGAFYASAHAGYFRHDLESVRPVTIGANTMRASGATDAGQFALGAEAGLSVPITARISAGPAARLRHTRVEIDGYAERGAGGFSAVLAGRAAEQTVLGLGAAASMALDDSRATVLFAELSWDNVIDGAGGAFATTASLAAAPAAVFAVEGRRLDDSYGMLSAGFDTALTGDVRLQGGIAADILRDDRSETRLTLGATFGF